MPVFPDVGSRMIESSRSRPARLEVLDQVLGDAVLDRARRVEHLELGEDADGRVRATSAGSRRAACGRSRRGCRRSGRRAGRHLVGMRRASLLVVGLVRAAAGRPSVSRRPSPAGAGPRRPARPASSSPVEVAHVLAVDVDVDEPVEVAVVGQQLPAERRVLLDERADHGTDRVAVELERLGAADVRTQDGRDEDRAHDAPPARPPAARHGHGTAHDVDAVDGSGTPALRAATACIRADRAVRVAAQLELGELGLEGIEQEQPAGQRVADPEQDLERLVRLEQAEDARARRRARRRRSSRARAPAAAGSDTGSGSTGPRTGRTSSAGPRTGRPRRGRPGCRPRPRRR